MAGRTAGAAPRAAASGLTKGRGGERPTVFYLWLLLGLELAATASLRSWSRNHHGG